MSTQLEVSQVHVLALETFGHLKQLDRSPAREEHIFRMICAAERAAIGVLDDAGAEQALQDIEAAALFCQSA